MAPMEPGADAPSAAPDAATPEAPAAEVAASRDITAPQPIWPAPSRSVDPTLEAPVPPPPADDAPSTERVAPEAVAAPSTPLGASPRRAALIGAAAGAVVAALVAAGVTVALDDDPSTVRTITPVTTSEGALDIQGILAKVQPSVVAIETSQTTSNGVFEGAGSGIVLSEDGLVLTNAHVIGGLSEITVVLPDGSDHTATLVGSSPDDDMALIQVEGVSDLTAAELGSSDDLRVGDEVIAIGNALNLGGEPTVTRGIVSAKDRSLSAQGVELQELLQTDAAINPGNSGGPLVNAAGQVVGMNTAIVPDAQNLGFAIPIDRARPIIERLEAGDGDITPDQAFLGVSSAEISELTPDVVSEYEIEVDEGAFVSEVVPGSAADEAGLRPGDVIIEIDGDTVDEPGDVRDAIVSREPGDTVRITIIRLGDERTVEAKLGRRGDSSS